MAILEKGLHKSESTILFGPLSDHAVGDVVPQTDGQLHYHMDITNDDKPLSDADAA